MYEASQPLSYDEFRTGLTYADVYHLIYSRKHKRRRGVLGYWRELKQKMYAEYLRNVSSIGVVKYAASNEPVPW